MFARVGDQLLVHSHTTNQPDRTGTIVAIHGTNGGPPYWVRFHEDGHLRLMYPSGDCEIVEPDTGP